MFKLFASMIESNKTYRELSRLTDYELADIGLTRHEIREVSRSN